MFKIILPLLFSACVESELYSPVPILPPISLGQYSFGQSNGIDWKCHEAEVNEKLVWIECQFQNLYHTNSNVCIQISYYKLSPSDEVAHSRNVCSGDLGFNEVSINNGAFIKDRRNLLTAKCNMGLDLCTLKTKAVIE